MKIKDKINLILEGCENDVETLFGYSQLGTIFNGLEELVGELGDSEIIEHLKEIIKIIMKRRQEIGNKEVEENTPICSNTNHSQRKKHGGETQDVPYVGTRTETEEENIEEEKLSSSSEKTSEVKE